MEAAGGVCVVGACTWCDEFTQPDPAPLLNNQGPGQRDEQQQEQGQEQQQEQEQEQQQQQQQRDRKLEPVAAREMRGPNSSQPSMLHHGPSIGIETEYVGKPQPQAPLELGASEPKGQWYSEGLVRATMIISWLAIVVSLCLLSWVPVKSFLGGAVGCVPSLPSLTSGHIFAVLPSTPLRSIAWQASEVVGAVTAVPVLGLAALSGLALGAHCWFWLRRGVTRAVNSSEFWKHTVMLGTSLGLFGNLSLLASEVMGPAHESKMQASYL